MIKKLIIKGVTWLWYLKPLNPFSLWFQILEVCQCTRQIYQWYHVYCQQSDMEVWNVGQQGCFSYGAGISTVTVLNKAVFQGATSLSYILRLTKCASEKVNNVFSLTWQVRCLRMITDPCVWGSVEWYMFHHRPSNTWGSVVSPVKDLVKGKRRLAQYWRLVWGAACYVYGRTTYVPLSKEPLSRGGGRSVCRVDRTGAAR